MKKKVETAIVWGLSALVTTAVLVFIAAEFQPSWITRCTEDLCIIGIVYVR